MIATHFRRNVTCLFSHWQSSFSFSVLQFSSFVSEEAQSCKNPGKLELLLHKHKFSPKVVSHVLSCLRFGKKKQTREKYESTLSYLKEFGFTKSELEKTLKSKPTSLVADVHKSIQPKVKILQDIGFSSRDIVSIILKEPNILTASAKNRLRPAILHLQVLLVSSEEVARTIRRSPWLLITDWEHRLIPNTKFLQCCGITKEHIVSHLSMWQRSLSSKPEFLRECVAKVDAIGVDRNLKMFSYAVATLGSFSAKAWELKWQAFRNILECSDKDMSTMFKRHPMVFLVSGDKVKKVKEFLMTSKYNNLLIYQCPNVLFYSIEKRYKPRCEVLTILERRHLIKKWPHPSSLGVMTDAKFLDKYVRPHLKDPEISTWYKNNPTRAGGRLISAA